MKKMKVAEKLFGMPERIQILHGKKKVGDEMPYSLRYSRRVKISGVAKVLDYLLVDKCINAIDATTGAPTQVYVEVDNYKMMCGVNREIMYANKELKGYYRLIPIVILALSNNFNAPKFKQAFSRIVEEYNDTGYVSEETVVEFCVQFDCEVISRLGNNLDIFRVYESDLAVAYVKKNYDNGMTKEISLLKNVAEKPDLSF